MNKFSKKEKIQILIGLALMFLMLFFNIKIVNASVLPYSNAYLNVNQCEVNCNVQGSNCFMDLNTCIWDNNNNLGHSVHFGSSNGFLNKIEFNIKDSGDYDPGNYSLIFNWGIDPRSVSEFNNKYVINLYGSRNNGGDTSISSTCSTTNGSGRFDFNTSCNFSTLEKFDHFIIQFVFVGNGCTFYSDDRTYRCPDMTLMPQLTTAMSFNSINLFEHDSNPSNAINNQTQIIQNEFNGVNSNINEINDTINDDNVDDPNSFFSDFDDLMPSNGVISSLIGLPITLYSRVLSSINGTCSSFNLGSLYGTDLIMPCIEVGDYLGSNLWNLIDIIISGIFIYTISRKFIKAFNNFTSLKEGDILD